MAKALQITYQVISQTPDNDLQLNFSVVWYIKFINDIAPQLTVVKF